jgi:hypothetical protein
MPMIEDVLSEKTYKQGGLDVGQRVFYTLTGGPVASRGAALQADRNSKAIALLFKVLREKDYITDAQLDEVLLELL